MIFFGILCRRKTWNILKTDQELHTELFSRWHTYIQQVSFLYGGTRHVFGDVVMSCLPVPAFANCQLPCHESCIQISVLMAKPTSSGLPCLLGGLQVHHSNRMSRVFICWTLCTLALMYLGSHTNIITYTHRPRLLDFNILDYSTTKLDTY